MFKPIFMTSSQQILSFLDKSRLMPFMQTIILYLDKNRCLIYQKNFTSNFSGKRKNLSSKDIFEPALIFEAKFIVICQIKPSGNISPTHTDESLAESIAHISRYLGVELLDYLLVNARDYYSRRETNLLDRIPITKENMSYA